MLSLPFERGLHCWLEGKPVPGTPSLFHLAERLACRGVEVLWLMLDWTGPVPPAAACIARCVMATDLSRSRSSRSQPATSHGFSTVPSEAFCIGC